MIRTAAKWSVVVLLYFATACVASAYLLFIH